ncbi:M23 family metallopeptidase [Microbacterium sp. 179-I 3D3 NHS]|uniref:M23 family metallopeptidase n=1 Tax=unclassified Microbacterium TaxID=2609290 RepID=UPI0039A261A8
MNGADAVELRFPFSGRWLVQNSPASRVPSHGTGLFGTSHAIDFVPLGADGRRARRSIASLLGTEPANIFAGFGKRVLAPVSGQVIVAVDGEEDHVARRSAFSLLSYALTQRSRIRRGAAAIAGNHVAISAGSAIVLIAHLRAGSILVRRGQHVAAGEPIGECGNSGNSTEPHVHVQVSESLERDARGIPLVFRHPDGRVRVPANGEIVDAG